MCPSVVLLNKTTLFPPKACPGRPWGTGRALGGLWGALGEPWAESGLPATGAILKMLLFFCCFFVVGLCCSTRGLLVQDWCGRPEILMLGICGPPKLLMQDWCRIGAGGIWGSRNKRFQDWCRIGASDLQRFWGVGKGNFRIGAGLVQDWCFFASRWLLSAQMGGKTYCCRIVAGLV